jgi:hypothetical protein
VNTAECWNARSRHNCTQEIHNYFLITTHKTWYNYKMWLSRKEFLDLLSYSSSSVSLQCKINGSSGSQYSVELGWSRFISRYRKKDIYKCILYLYYNFIKKFRLRAMGFTKLLSINALFTEIHLIEKQNIIEIRLALWEMIHIDFHIFLSFWD